MSAKTSKTRANTSKICPNIKEMLAKGSKIYPTACVIEKRKKHQPLTRYKNQPGRVPGLKVNVYI